MNHRQRRHKKRQEQYIKNGLSRSGKISPAEFARKKSNLLLKWISDQIEETKTTVDPRGGATTRIYKNIALHVLQQYELGRKSNGGDLKNHGDNLIQAYKLWTVVRGFAINPETGRTDRRIVFLEKHLIKLGSKKAFFIPVRHLVSGGLSELEVFFDRSEYKDNSGNTVVVYTMRSPKSVARILGLRKPGRIYEVPAWTFALDTPRLRRRLSWCKRKYAGRNRPNGVISFRNILYLAVVSDRRPGSYRQHMDTEHMAYKKGNLNFFGGSLLSRDSIQKLTTLTKPTQIEIEKTLECLGLLRKSHTSSVFVKPQGMTVAEHEANIPPDIKYYKVTDGGDIVAQGPNRYTFRGNTVGKSGRLRIPRDELSLTVADNSTSWKYEDEKPMPWCTEHSGIDIHHNHGWIEGRPAALFAGVFKTWHKNITEVYIMSPDTPSRSKRAEKFGGVPNSTWGDRDKIVEKASKTFSNPWKHDVYSNQLPPAEFADGPWELVID